MNDAFISGCIFLSFFLLPITVSVRCLSYALNFIRKPFEAELCVSVIKHLYVCPTKMPETIRSENTAALDKPRGFIKKKGVKLKEEEDEQEKKKESMIGALKLCQL